MTEFENRNALAIDKALAICPDADPLTVLEVARKVSLFLQNDPDLLAALDQPAAVIHQLPKKVS